MGGIIAVLRITSLGAFAYFLVLTGWQLITRRPTMTVSRTGVQIGKTSIAWPQIARIDDPPIGTFVPGSRSIQLQPVDRYGSRALAITHEYALDLINLAAWLRTLHTQQSHPTDG
ncbi:hypothetical protein [Kribbella sp. NPDC051718]|uniref:hypothetical protein n=1 Tax=Kribbella sp. NPDC051718 TaxID=3155168 RepID=UPI003440627A